MTLGTTATDGVGRSLLHPFAQHRRTSSSNLNLAASQVANGKGAWFFYSLVAPNPSLFFACPKPPRPPAPGPPSLPPPKLGRRWTVELEGQSESPTRALGPPACLHLAHVALLEPRPAPLRDPRGSAPPSPPPKGQAPSHLPIHPIPPRAGLRPALRQRCTGWIQAARRLSKCAPDAAATHFPATGGGITFPPDATFVANLSARASLPVPLL